MNTYPSTGPLLTLRTPPFAHYGLAFSPFHPGLLALASSANYGLIGNGRLHIARMLPPTPGMPAAVNGPDWVGTGVQLDKR